MAFVQDKFIPSGVYIIINARQHGSIVPSDDNEERVTASSNDDDKVSASLLIFRFYNITFPLDPVVNPSIG